MSKNTTQNHTPLPWQVHVDAVYDQTGNMMVADCWQPRPLKMTGRANAELIVRAVNSHADLLAALEAINARINGEWDHPALKVFGPLGGAVQDINRISAVAINKACGGDR